MLEVHMPQGLEVRVLSRAQILKWRVYPAYFKIFEKRTRRPQSRVYRGTRGGLRAFSVRGGEGLVGESSLAHNAKITLFIDVVSRVEDNFDLNMLILFYSRE